MCLWHRIYKWVSDLNLGQVARVPADIRDEILMVALCMPIASAPIRWPISNFISATDATPSAGGGVECEVSPELARNLWYATIDKSDRIRMDDPREILRQARKGRRAPLNLEETAQLGPCPD